MPEIAEPTNAPFVGKEPEPPTTPTQELLTEIRDRLPAPDAPKTIASDNQALLNTNLERIADGRSLVVAPPVVKPVIPDGVRAISRPDEASVDEIASGKAVVVG